MQTQLYMALYKTFHAQKNKIRPGMTEIGLSPGQPKILHYLSRTNNCMQKEIAAALDIEPATVSQLLNKMVSSGLIQRSDSAERRRAECISITEKGRALYERWDLLGSRVEEAALQGFSPDERERFLGYLCRMYRNLTGKSLE